MGPGKQDSWRPPVRLTFGGLNKTPGRAKRNQLLFLKKKKISYSLSKNNEIS
jgi:hypothetical protein